MRPPDGVNLIAFDSKLDSTWRKRSPSAEMTQFVNAQSVDSAMPFASALPPSSRTASRTMRTRSTGARSSRVRPVASDDASSRSPTIRDNDRALRSIASIACCANA